MKPNLKFTQSVAYIAGLLMVVFVSSCASYENASVNNDGIYANDTVANENETQENTNNNSDYYQNYFDQQDKLISRARAQNEVFTDVDSYTSEDSEEVAEEDITTEPENVEYNSYGGWGTQPTSVSYNYVDNSFFPAWGWGGFGPGWGWGGFGPGWGWGGFYGPGWGWGGFGPGWGWGGFGFGWGGFGPGWGWGGFYGPGLWGFNNHFYAHNNLSYHRNFRTRSSFLNRGRSNLANNNRSNRSNLNRNSRTRVDANRSRSGRYATTDGRRIRNSSNVNARYRNSRGNDRSTTTRSRGNRSGYSNQSIYRGSSRSNTVRSRGNSRSYSPRSSNTRTRSSRSSSRVRSSGRSGGSRSSGSRGGGGRSSRGGRG